MRESAVILLHKVHDFKIDNEHCIAIKLQTDSLTLMDGVRIETVESILPS